MRWIAAGCNILWHNAEVSRGRCSVARALQVIPGPAHSVQRE